MEMIFITRHAGNNDLQLITVSESAEEGSDLETKWVLQADVAERTPVTSGMLSNSRNTEGEFRSIISFSAMLFYCQGRLELCVNNIRQCVFLLCVCVLKRLLQNTK